MTILRILVVEDDRLVADALKSTLSHCNYAVEIANDGRAGLDFIEAFDYDLLLLDVMLPQLDGISICRQVRSRGYTMPILLLTAIEGDRAVGLDAGADDYALKPFDPEDLTARIRALLRRATDRAQPILSWENLTLDPRNYQVAYRGNPIALTPKEYALLELFLRQNQRILSCGAILEHLWTYDDTPSAEAVRTHIKGLRHKLRLAGAPVDPIETVYGIGYRLKRIDSRSRRSLAQSLPTPPADEESNTLQLLGKIWDRHQAQMFDRTNQIERVITTLEDRTLTTEIRTQAWHSAHTLAGALGTFGLPLGSEIAKQLELLLGSQIDITPAQIAQLRVGVDELRRQIASKVGSTISIDESVATEGDAMPRHSRSVGDPGRLCQCAESPLVDVRVRLLLISQDLETILALQAAAPDNLAISVAQSIVTEAVPSHLNPQPQLIIFDLDVCADLLDGLSGLTALARYYPQIPIVVLSQFESLDRRIEVARRGGRLFLAKPISGSCLLLEVDRILQQVKITSAKVTIVDDDVALLEGLTALLSPWGISVTTLAEPTQLWETLAACVPDLLILDLDLPTHDGIELCRAVRTDPRWASLPIMFITAHTAAMAIDRIFAAGADDFVTKPIVGSIFAARILHRLQRKWLVAS